MRAPISRRRRRNQDEAGTSSGGRGLAIALLTATAVWAQAGATAQISGTVRDSSGAVLPGVDVTATQTDTNFVRSTVTDAGGTYVLSNLPTGPYRLQATLSGFRTFQRTGIVLQVNANPEIIIEMAIGELAETVSVEAATPLVETRSPAVGEVIENERIEELPLNGRNPTELIALAGAAVPQPALNASSRSMQGGTAIAVAGGSAVGVAYLLDGATHNNPYDNLNLPFPFPDALQEFRIETSTTNANNGMHSGASVNVVTKSGTNLLHGDLFEFVRDHRFNATNPFNLIDPATGKRQGDGLNRNQFGGTLGGPVATDRVFFFGAYQGTRLRETPADLFDFVPTAAMLAGDFTQYASAQCNATGAVTLRAPFVNNRINPALFSPAALKVAAALPNDDRPVRPLHLQPQPAAGRSSVHRQGRRAAQPESLDVRTLHVHRRQVDAAASSCSRTTSWSRARVGATTRLMRSPSATRWCSATRRSTPSGSPTTTPTSTARTSRLVSRPRISASRPTAISRTTCSSRSPTAAFRSEEEPRARPLYKTPSYSLSDDLTIVRGAHQYGDRRQRGVLEVADASERAITRTVHLRWLDHRTSPCRLPDRTSAVTHPGDAEHARHAAVVPRAVCAGHLEAVVEDDLELRPEVGAGLRAAESATAAIYNFSEDRFLNNVKTTQYANAPPGFLYPGDEGFVNGNAGMKDNLWQFSPRVGFAWDPAGDGKMSIRTGYSLGYDFINAQFHLNTSSVAPPFSAEARVTNPAGGFDDPWRGTGNENFFPFTVGPDSPFPLTGPYISLPPDIKPPRQQSWNLGVQRQIGNDMAVSATYLGLLLGSAVECAIAQSGRLHPRLLHAADGDRSPVLPGLLGQRRTSINADS